MDVVVVESPAKAKTINKYLGSNYKVLASFGLTITATPSAQSTRFITTRTSAVWKAVATACERDDFRPRPSKLCEGCAYRRWCPEFGGDPALASTEAPVVLGATRAA